MDQINVLHVQQGSSCIIKHVYLYVRIHIMAIINNVSSVNLHATHVIPQQPPVTLVLQAIILI